MTSTRSYSAERKRGYKLFSKLSAHILIGCYSDFAKLTYTFRIICNILVCSVKPVLQYRQNRLYSTVCTDADLFILYSYSAYCISIGLNVSRGIRTCAKFEKLTHLKRFV